MWKLLVLEQIRLLTEHLGYYWKEENGEGKLGIDRENTGIDSGAKDSQNSID